MERQEESIFAMLKFAVMPIAKVFVMCFLGFLMASKHVNILTASGRKLLNGLVFTLLLPCLIFTQLGRSVTLQKMIEWWFIPVNVVLAAVFGSLIGLTVASVVRPPPEYFKFTIIQIGIGNIGNVPLVLVSALCRDKANPFGDSDTCNQVGSAYISFGQWDLVIIRRRKAGTSLCSKMMQTYISRSMGFGMLFAVPKCRNAKKPRKHTRNVFGLYLETSNRLGTVPDMRNSTECLLVVGAVILYTYVFSMLAPPKSSVKGNFESATVEDGTNCENLGIARVPLLAQEGGSVDCSPSAPMISFPKTKRARILHCIIICLSSLAEKLKIKQILQPPIIASVLAMVIGAVPFLKQLILTDSAPFFFITDSCVILGGAMIPCILLALGGNLVGGPGSSKLGVRTTVAIIFGRLFLVPPVGLGIVTLADKLGFLPPGDKMFRFVLLLQHTMPTSVLSGAVANLRGFAEKEASAVLFWVHIFAIFSMAMWIILYLDLLF